MQDKSEQRLHEDDSERQAQRTFQTSHSHLWAHKSQPHIAKAIALPIQHLRVLIAQLEGGSNRQDFVSTLSGAVGVVREAGMQGGEGDLELSAELAGVKAAVSALRPYEICVGIEVPTPSRADDILDLSREMDEEAVALHQKKWRELMEELAKPFEVVSDPLVPRELLVNPLAVTATDNSGAVRETVHVKHAVSLLPALDLASMGHSGGSPLTPQMKTLTPRGTRSCTLTPFEPALLHDSESLSSYSSTDFESKRSTTPSLSFSTNSSPKSIATSPTPPLSDFIFPSLHPKILLEKDEHGFFSALEEDHSPGPLFNSDVATSLLPSFMIEENPKRRSNPSKTRTIVDRLKLDMQRRSPDSQRLSPDPQHCSSSDLRHSSDSQRQTPESTSIVKVPFGSIVKPTPKVIDEGDGWLGFGEPYQPDMSRAEQKRELFLASRRAQAVASEPPAKVLASTKPAKKQAPSSTDGPPTILSRDGWIDFKQPPQSQTHHRSRSQNKRHVSSQSASNHRQPVHQVAPSAYPTFHPVAPSPLPPPQPFYYQQPHPLPSVIPVPVPAVPMSFYPGYHPPQPMVVPAPYAPPYAMYPVHTQQHARPTPVTFPPLGAGGKRHLPYSAASPIVRPTPITSVIHPPVW